MRIFDFVEKCYVENLNVLLEMNRAFNLRAGIMSYIEYVFSVCYCGATGCLSTPAAGVSNQILPITMIDQYGSCFIISLLQLYSTYGSPVLKVATSVTYL